MRKLTAVCVAIFLLMSSGANRAHAEAGVAGGCPDGFHLHMLSEMGHEHADGEHHHTGISTDANSDGWICSKHVGAEGTNHVHSDNNAVER